MSAITFLCQGYYWMEKQTNKEFKFVMVLIIRPCSILKFQFVFGFNDTVQAIFSLLKFLVLNLGYGCTTFDFTTDDIKSPLIHAHEWKA